MTRTTIGMILLSVALGACAGPPATQAPTTEPIATSEAPTAPPTAQPILALPTATPRPTAVSTPTKADIKDGIQQTLNQYVKAYNDNDPDLFLQTIDPTNLPFRRYVRAHFDAAQQSFLADRWTPRFYVKTITMREKGFVLAHIETRSGAGAYWLEETYE